MSNIFEIFEDINKDNFSKITDAFMLRNEALKVEEAGLNNLTLSNINTKLKTMINLPTLIDRINQRIEILTDEKKAREEFIEKLDINKEDHRKTIITETQEVLKADIIIEEYTKLLNDEH